MAARNTAIIVIVAFFLQSAVSQTSVDYCQALGDVISVCQIQTPSFTALSASQQASCLCGSTLGTFPWGPASFDGLASSCAIEYATVNPTLAYDARELSGLCTAFAVQGQSVVASSTPTPTSFIAGSTSQISGNSVPSNTGGLFSVSPGSSPTTVISVVTVSPSTTTNAAAGMKRACRDVFGLGLAIGGVAVGGYIMA